MWHAAQVTERFSFNLETTMQRRDLRSGEQRARLAATPDGLLASIRWGDPHAGESRVFRVAPPNERLLAKRWPAGQHA